MAEKPHMQKILSALAEPSRYRLLLLICEHARFYNPYENKPASLNCANKLKLLSGLSQATIAHHVKILQEAGLIYSLRKGKFKYLFPRESGFTGLGDIGKELLESVKGSKKMLGFAAIDFAAGGEKGARIFTQAMDFLSLHGFQKSGPTNYANNPEAVKYGIMKNHEQSGLIEIVYSPKEGKIFLNRPQKNYSWIKENINAVKEKLDKFIRSKSISAGNNSTP